MPAARPHLASWERRFCASAIDALLLFLALALLACAMQVLGEPPTASVFLAPAAYVAYQSSGTMKPHLSLGRTVAGIAVVSVRRGGVVSTVQSVVRPVIRLAGFAVAAVAADVMDFDTRWCWILPPGMELTLIAVTSWRQSVADFLSGSLVVTLPPPQAHRAPAVPMFSAHDAEFGMPPRRRG
jgi:uncharacterized RDD family membrane protein YckC